MDRYEIYALGKRFLNSKQLHQKQEMRRFSKQSTSSFSMSNISNSFSKPLASKKYNGNCSFVNLLAASNRRNNVSLSLSSTKSFSTSTPPIMISTRLNTSNQSKYCSSGIDSLNIRRSMSLNRSSHEITNRELVSGFHSRARFFTTSQSKSDHPIESIPKPGIEGEPSYSVPLESQNNEPASEIKIRTPAPKPSLISMYIKLSKARLGSMVVLSTIFGYLLAPGVIDPWIFASTVLGTSFTVASANSINQYLEVDHDSLMKRTKNRPLPSGDMSMNHALAFGLTTGAAGTIILGTLVNPLCATLAFSNIILYTLVYTPMKRVHPINTAIGSIVGAIPPLIGWAAQTGGLEAGSWVTFLVLLLWQMPHFHALSWPLRHDYGSAGYKMLCNVSPSKVSRNTLLYTIALLGLGPFAAYTGLTNWHFAYLAALPTLPWIKEAWTFHKDQSNISARKTFKMSLYWLPIFFAIMCFNLNPDNDRDTIEEDVIAIHQHQHLLDEEIASSQSTDKSIVE